MDGSITSIDRSNVTLKQALAAARAAVDRLATLEGRIDRIASRYAAMVVAQGVQLHLVAQEDPFGWSRVLNGLGIKTRSTSVSECHAAARVLLGGRPYGTVNLYAGAMGWALHRHLSGDVAIDDLTDAILAAGGLAAVAMAFRKECAKVRSGPRGGETKYRRLLRELPVAGYIESSDIPGDSLAVLSKCDDGRIKVIVLNQDARRVRESALRLSGRTGKRHRFPPLPKKEVPRRRFSRHAPALQNIHPLAEDHPAVLGSRTLYPSTVVDPGEENVLKPGSYSRKLGDRVTKGRWAGMPILSLSLEERKTCPPDCTLLTTCYGNNMRLARRYRHGPALESKLDAELAILNVKYPNGFVVRLHALGDFYSLEYVNKWLDWLDRYDHLHVFGYSSWKTDTPIGAALQEARRSRWDRFAVRISNADASSRGAITISHEARGSTEQGIVCHTQTGEADCCGSCTLCWSTDRNIVFMVH